MGQEYLSGNWYTIPTNDHFMRLCYAASNFIHKIFHMESMKWEYVFMQGCTASSDLQAWVQRSISTMRALEVKGGIRYSLVHVRRKTMLLKNASHLLLQTLPYWNSPISRPTSTAITHKNTSQWKLLYTSLLSAKVLNTKASSTNIEKCKLGILNFYIKYCPKNKTWSLLMRPRKEVEQVSVNHSSS